MVSVRFCPFCRESFEDERACPEHGLALVGLRTLPPLTTSPPEDSWLPLGTLRHGRLWLLCAACVWLLGFSLPLAAMHGAVVAQSTLLELANGRAKTLWLVPAAACALLALFVRRRTLASLRAVRLAVGMLSLLPAVVTGMRLAGARQAAELLTARAGEPVVVTIGAGACLVFAGTLLGLIASFDLGSSRHRALRVQQLDQEHAN